MSEYKLSISDSIVSFVTRSTYGHPIPRLEPCLGEEVQQWCDDNLEFQVRFGGTRYQRSYLKPDLFYPIIVYHVLFETSNDLLMFKLRWADELAQ